MDIGNIFSDSLGYPSKNLKRVVVLGLSLLFSILIIPLFIVLGYALRVIRNSAEGGIEPPAFDELGTMIVDGLKYMVVVMGYFFIPGILVAMGMVPVIASIIESGDVMSNSELITIITGSGLCLLGVLLAMVISVIANMGIANMAHTGELGAAFRFGEILRIIGSIGWGRYIGWYILLIILSLLFTAVGLLLEIIPIVGYLVQVLLISPYAFIFQYRAIGLIYREGI
jgi:hypothetical protein